MIDHVSNRNKHAAVGGLPRSFFQWRICACCPTRPDQIRGEEPRTHRRVRPQVALKTASGGREQRRIALCQRRKEGVERLPHLGTPRRLSDSYGGSSESRKLCAPIVLRDETWRAVGARKRRDVGCVRGGVASVVAAAAAALVLALHHDV